MMREGDVHAPEVRARLRRCWRLSMVLAHIGYGLLLAVLVSCFCSTTDRPVRSLTQHWFRRLLALLAVEVEITGPRPQQGVFLVSNHVSWLDIPVIGSAVQVYFLSKAEVRDWPLIGALAAAAGTLFIRRGAGESRQKAVELAVHLEAQRTVLVFPEATTTDGREVKRFHSPLFLAPLLSQTGVQPIAIRYVDEQGNPDRLPAFVGEDSFAAHLWWLMLRHRIRVHLEFLPPLAAEVLSADALAIASRNAVCAALTREPDRLGAEALLR